MQWFVPIICLCGKVFVSAVLDSLLMCACFVIDVMFIELVFAVLRGIVASLNFKSVRANQVCF